ncbi:DUF6924 domain-containing protein [Lentzea sp. NPDC058450]|uniref:DUF6924 domain-containing protein n=1 Tax=Lentzea sp. NPDC058450 TaxID=3346505 RepID=UPI00365626BF
MTSRLPSTPWVPVIRTDFSDHGVWAHVKARIGRVPPAGDEARVTFVDDPALAGRTVAELLALGPDRLSHALLLVVDEVTIRSREHAVLVVDLGIVPDAANHWLGRPAGRSFRAVPGAVRSVENTLTLGLADWDLLARRVDDDGVYRVRDQSPVSPARRGPGQLSRKDG